MIEREFNLRAVADGVDAGVTSRLLEDAGLCDALEKPSLTPVVRKQFCPVFFSVLGNEVSRRVGHAQEEFLEVSCQGDTVDDAFTPVLQQHVRR